jgi:hypothetical protein
MPDINQEILFKTSNEAVPYLRAYSNMAIYRNPAGPYSGTLDLPATPVIHPYHPIDGRRVDAGIAKFPVTICLPAPCDPNIMANLGVANVERFITMQTNPWTNISLLFRPHPWVHQDAPEEGFYSQRTNIDLWLATNTEQFINHRQHEVFTHSESNNRRELTPVVYSPNNMPLPREITDHRVTNVFFSICVDRRNNRAAITLHVLLNDADFQELQTAISSINRPQNLESFLIELNNRGVDIPEVNDFAHGIMPRLGAAPVEPNPINAIRVDAFLTRQRQRQEEIARLERERVQGEELAANAAREAQQSVIYNNLVARGIKPGVAKSALRL